MQKKQSIIPKKEFIKVLIVFFLAVFMSIFCSIYSSIKY